MSQIIQQRSPEWRQQRYGKFTSSRINDLMGIKGLGKTGETYAFDLACDIVFGPDEDEGFVSFDMRHGIETEPLAFEFFKQQKALQFLEVTECGFFSLNQNTGGSPDGLVSDNSVLEIKCPKPGKLFRLIADGLIDQCYIDQMQHQMWVTATEKAYFLNYAIFNGEVAAHEIIVPRDEARIFLMKSRIDEAVVIRDGFVEKLRANRQW